MSARLAVIFASLSTFACSSSTDSSPFGNGALDASSGGTGAVAGASGFSTSGFPGSGGLIAGGGGGSGATPSGGGAPHGGGPSTGGASTGGAGIGGTSAGGTPGAGGSGARIEYVFVVTMENHDGTSIYGNTASAPYLNGTLIPAYAKASNFVDPLPIGIVSEPHYVWMEAGTNVFSDHTFTGDDDPSATNSTASTQHLSTQIDAKGGLSWLAYQQGIGSGTGACPIHTSGFYAPKHDPFVFFQDVAGSPPSATNAGCVSHHRGLDTLSQDLTQKRVARYNFISPDQCNDMHGQFGCASVDLIRPGDDWLAAHIPELITFCNANAGVVFVVWDEGETTDKLPFVAVGPSVKKGYVSNVKYTHGSLVKTVERIFGLPVLPAVSGDSDFGDLLETGALP